MTITPAERERMAGKERRDLGALRSAYKAGDVATSRVAHEATPLLLQLQPPGGSGASTSGSTEVHGGAASDYIKSIVFGGLDGILTTFAIVTAAAGAGDHISATAVLIFGFANLLADGFAMGFGEYTSSKAELDFALEERRREEWELETNPEGEREEMVELYTQKGIAVRDAEAMIDVLMRYPKIFVDLMMVDELGIHLEDVDEWAPMKQGMVMFLAFVTFGAVPLLAYLPTMTPHRAVTLACVLTACCLAVLGALKGHLLKASAARAAVQMVLSGAFAAVVSFGVSALVTSLFEPPPSPAAAAAVKPAPSHHHTGK